MTNLANKKLSKQKVNIFFAVDEKYIKFMAVTLKSIKQNYDTARKYCITVLHTGVSQESENKIFDSFSEPNFEIKFYNIAQHIKDISTHLFVRDYYSATTYYRLFIPELFPKMKKCLYLDCDIVLSGDISRLYDEELGDNLVGAIADEAVNSISEFSCYTENRLGIRGANYFNAGVLLMNLEKMREMEFSKIFLIMLQQVKFTIAQDQDYLNVICKGRVALLDREWNVMPLSHKRTGNEKLIHFNLDNKPWKKDGVPFGEMFWKYARETEFISEIEQEKFSITAEQIHTAKVQTQMLMQKCLDEANDKRMNARIHQLVNNILTAEAR